MQNGNGNGQDKLIEKIRKLMALSESPNEHEAARAAEKAQAMLAEHNLSMADVTSGITEEDFRIDEDLLTDSVPWRRTLANSVARMYFCKYFYTHVKKPAPQRTTGYIRYDKHSFVGAKHNLTVAIEMFKYLDKTVERLANEGAAKQSSGQSSYRTSFKHACANRLYHRIEQRIREAKEGNIIKTESGNTLPALADLYDRTSKQLDSFIEEEVGKLRNSKPRGKMSNAAGVQDGRAAGDKIGLDGQVGGKSTRLLG